MTKSALAHKVEAANDHPAAEADETPVGCGYQFNFGGSALEMQCVIHASAPLGVWNATLDKMRKAGERQKTLADIRTAENNVVIQQRERYTAEERIKVADVDFDHMTQRRNERIEKANKEAAVIESADRERFDASAKRGDYQPSADAKARIARKRSDIEHEMAEQARAEDEKSEAMRGHHDAIRSIDHTQAWWESEIERLKALLEE